MSDAARHLKLVDLVDELTSWHVHTEHYAVREAGRWTGSDYRVKVAPLILQLQFSAMPDNTEAGSSSAFGSRPAARLDAIDAYRRITVEADDWLITLNQPVPHDTIDRVRRLASLARTHPDRQGDITHTIRSWWVEARVATGWDTPPWRPDNTCPACGERGTLRVRLAEHLASCRDCRATWDATTIGLLADHVRTENDAETQAVDVVTHTPCYCPLPKPKLEDLRYQCRWCGSIRCHHALATRALQKLRDACSV